MRSIIFGVVIGAITMMQTVVSGQDDFKKLSKDQFEHKDQFKHVETGYKITVLNHGGVLVSHMWPLSPKPEFKERYAFAGLRINTIFETSELDIWYGAMTVDGKIQKERVLNISPDAKKIKCDQLNDVYEQFEIWSKRNNKIKGAVLDDTHII